VLDGGSPSASRLSASNAVSAVGSPSLIVLLTQSLTAGGNGDPSRRNRTVGASLYDRPMSAPGPDVPSSAAVEEFLGSVENQRRRADTAAVIELMGEITGEPPKLWGTIIGFGSYHYRYVTGREGDSMVVGVSPRKAALTLYGLAFYGDEPLLDQLGEHSRGKGCVYIKDLQRVDQDVLGQLIRQAWERSAAVNFVHDATAGGSGPS
jgi:hypothetical protein